MYSFYLISIQQFMYAMVQGPLVLVNFVVAKHIIESIQISLNLNIDDQAKPILTKLGLGV